MPSQLFTNGKIEFLACKPFTSTRRPSTRSVTTSRREEAQQHRDASCAHGS